MRLFDLWLLCRGALSAHRLRSRLTKAAIAVGIGSVLLLTALGEGAREWVEGQFSVLGSNVLIVLPGRTQTRGGPPLAHSTTREITLEDMVQVGRRMSGIRRVFPIVVGEATVRHGGRGRVSSLVGSTQDFFRIRSARMALGQGLPERDPLERAPVCVIGRKVQREIFGEANPLGERIRVGDFMFRVVGTVAETGMSSGFNMDEVVVVPVASALPMLNRRGLFRMVVEVPSAADLEAAQKKLNDILKERHDGEEDFTILTPGAIAASLGNIITVITLALSAIAAVSLAVAGIGVMNVMVVSVAERTGEIGLLKAVGASNRQVLALFLGEAILLAAAGGAFGVAGGYAAAQAAFLLYPTIPFRVPGWAVYAALGVSVAVGISFGILPALRAARLQPVEALRKKG